MKCPNCNRAMRLFGTTGKKDGDKHCCDDCRIHIEGGVITHGKDKVKKMKAKVIAPLEDFVPSVISIQTQKNKLVNPI